MDLITIIGLLAVVTSGLRLSPQIVKSFKTKKVRDVSLLWEIIGVTSSFLWLIYGYLRGDMILMSGGIVLVLSYVILIYQKFLYRWFYKFIFILYFMSWKTLTPLWRKQVIAVILYIIAYVLTIPWRGYEFLNGFIDISQGVPMKAHLLIILVVGIILSIFLWILDFINKNYK